MWRVMWHVTWHADDRAMAQRITALHTVAGTTQDMFSFWITKELWIWNF